MKMRQEPTISERRACGLVGACQNNITARGRRSTRDDPSLKARIVDLAYARRRFGYRRIHDLLRREGVQANHKKVYRLYREAALSVAPESGDG